MSERINGTVKSDSLMGRILALTNQIQGQDLVDLVLKTGNTDRGVKIAVKRLVKDGKLHVSAGRFSSHSAYTA